MLCIATIIIDWLINYWNIGVSKMSKTASFIFSVLSGKHLNTVQEIQLIFQNLFRHNGICILTLRQSSTQKAVTANSQVLRA